jgi:hypothetical protein
VSLEDQQADVLASCGEIALASKLKELVHALKFQASRISGTRLPKSFEP